MFLRWPLTHLSGVFLAAPVNLTAEEIEQKWQELASDLSAILQGHAGEIPESAIPFDAASEVPVDEQKWVTGEERHLMTHFHSYISLYWDSALYNVGNISNFAKPTCDYTSY